MLNKTDAEKRLQKVIVSPELTIADIIPILDRAGFGVLLLCDKNRKLLGVVTDGDIRRAMMQGWSFDNPCLSIATTQPIFSNYPISPDEALHLMDHSRSFLVNQLPILDEQGRVIDLIIRSDLIAEKGLDVSVVIMAGGLSKRLRPLTEDLPKPMLPVGDRPLLEHLIKNLHQIGIEQVNVTTHYLSEKITKYFGSGEDWGVKINYLSEDQPLGTAGALTLIPESNQPILVINGDILTLLDYRAMLAYHKRQNADMTVAVRQYGLRIPYGVLECDESRVVNVREKPDFNFLVNAGIYLLQPGVLKYIPGGQQFNMTDLIETLVGEGIAVYSFPIVEYWMDIGQMEDYEQAQKDIQTGRFAQ
jgi:dTDP-glucose pyrophosphorylase/CBS domain-containing protein